MPVDSTIYPSGLKGHFYEEDPVPKFTPAPTSPPLHSAPQYNGVIDNIGVNIKSDQQCTSSEDNGENKYSINFNKKFPKWILTICIQLCYSRVVWDLEIKYYE